MKASKFTDAQKAFVIKQGEEGTPMGMPPAAFEILSFLMISVSWLPRAVQQCGNLLVPVPVPALMRLSIGNDEFPVFRWSGSAEGATVARTMVSAASIIGRSGSLGFISWNARVPCAM